MRLAQQTPFKMWLIREGGLLRPAAVLDGIDEPYNLPRQALPLAYWQDGYIDISRPLVILEKKSTTGENILPFIIEEDTIDIDYPDEIEAAERLFAKNRAISARVTAKIRGVRHPS